ncbi:MAG: hypothetical protein KDC43_15285 [Saprospiraceae bacterium]|nr:hypothetical protein [Saprospiraceae bacterium]MCB0625237.1 hypothetical protein [Saprospiraceae bacterium]MCB0682943.1 hypothetical protein [Saprospiraceae bacterium]
MVRKIGRPDMPRQPEGKPTKCLTVSLMAKSTLSADIKIAKPVEREKIRIEREFQD